MEESKKRPVTLREIIVNRAIGSFFGFYVAYMWLGTDGAKADIVAAFGIRFFAVTKALVLLAAMGSGVFGGLKLVMILIKLKKTIRIVDLDGSDQQQSSRNIVNKNNQGPND